MLTDRSSKVLELRLSECSVLHPFASVGFSMSIFPTTELDLISFSPGVSAALFT